MPRSEKRRAVLQAVHKAGRTHSAHSTVFYSVVAGRLGITLSDLRVWDLLYYRGPMSARQVADVIGLSQGAVTGLLKRLERVGAVSCRPDPGDRRRIIVTVLGSFREGPASDYFDDFMGRVRTMYSRYSDDELMLIARYMQEIGDLLREESLRLRANPDALAPLTAYKRNRRSKPRKGGSGSS